MQKLVPLPADQKAQKKRKRGSAKDMVHFFKTHKTLPMHAGYRLGVSPEGLKDLFEAVLTRYHEHVVTLYERKHRKQKRRR